MKLQLENQQISLNEILPYTKHFKNLHSLVMNLIDKANTTFQKEQLFINNIENKYEKIVNSVKDVSNLQNSISNFKLQNTIKHVTWIIGTITIGITLVDLFKNEILCFFKLM